MCDTVYIDYYYKPWITIIMSMNHNYHVCSQLDCEKIYIVMSARVNEKSNIDFSLTRDAWQVIWKYIRSGFCEIPTRKVGVAS